MFISPLGVARWSIVEQSGDRKARTYTSYAHYTHLR
jgi:hypothetical protein